MHVLIPVNSIVRTWVNDVHRKTDYLFPGNSMTIVELEPLTIWSGGSDSNHYAHTASLKKENFGSSQLKGLKYTCCICGSSHSHQNAQFDGYSFFLWRQCGVVVRAWVVQVQLRSCCFLERECPFFCGLHYLYNTNSMVNPNQHSLSL